MGCGNNKNGALYNWYAVQGTTEVVESIITLTTTLTGSFSVSLQGNGSVIVTWPGSSTQLVPLNGMGEVTVTRAIDGGGVITISNASVITQISCISMNLTGCVIPISCININTIILNGNQLTSFVTSSQWVNLTVLHLDSNQIASLTTYAEWVNLTTIIASNNLLTSFVIHSQWTLIDFVYLIDNNIVESSVNACYIMLDSIWGTGHYAHFAGNAAPTGAGLTAYNSLIAKGNTLEL